PPLLFFRPPLPPPHTPLPSPPLFRSLPHLPQPGPPVHVVPTRNHRPPSQSSGRHRDSHGSVARADCGSDPGESPTQPVHFAPVVLSNSCSRGLDQSLPRRHLHTGSRRRDTR